MSSTQQILDVMEQQQQIEASGWELFKSAYNRTKPPPILEKEQRQERGWVYYSMLAGGIGAFTVGALQTIPAFYIIFITAGLHWVIAGVGGVGGFFAIDVSMFATSHYLVKAQWQTRNGDKNSFNKVVDLIRFAQIFGGVVSIASNFYFVFFAYRINEQIAGSDTPVTLTVAILLALAPAIQGLALGSVIAALPITQDIQNLRVKRRNRELLNDYEKTMVKSWNGQKQKYGVVDMSERIERLQDNPQSVSTLSVDNRQTALDNNRVSEAVDKVIRHLQDNPQNVSMTVRDLGAIVGVGKDSAAKGRKHFTEASQ